MLSYVGTQTEVHFGNRTKSSMSTAARIPNMTKQPRFSKDLSISDSKVFQYKWNRKQTDAFCKIYLRKQRLVRVL